MLYQLSYLGIVLRWQNDAYCSVISSRVNGKSGCFSHMILSASKQHVCYDLFNQPRLCKAGENQKGAP